MKIKEVILNRANQNETLKAFLLILAGGLCLLLLVGAGQFIRLKVKHGSMHQHQIDSFAGCFWEGKSSWQSYENMTPEEIKDSLNRLGLSETEFNNRKDACMKAHQLESFAGCTGTKYLWKTWDKMDENEFNDTLKYFNLTREKFENIRNGCERSSNRY